MADRTKDPMMQPCRKGCGELVHLENDGFHVCRTSKTKLEQAWAFVERVATYFDYTHDDVDELAVLKDLQAEANKLWDPDWRPDETTDKPRLTGQCDFCQRRWTVIGETGADVIVSAFHCPCGHTTVMD